MKASGRACKKTHNIHYPEISRMFLASKDSGYICSICNKIIDFSRGVLDHGDDGYIPNDQFSPSADRLDCSKDYIKNNCRITHRICNVLRKDNSISFVYSNSDWNPTSNEISKIVQNNDDIILNNGMVNKIILIESDKVSNQHKKYINNMNTSKLTPESVMSYLTSLSFEERKTAIETMASIIGEVKIDVEKGSKLVSSFEEACKSLGYSTQKGVELLMGQYGFKTKSETKYSRNITPERATHIVNSILESGVKKGTIFRASDVSFKAANVYKKGTKSGYFENLISDCATANLAGVKRISKGNYRID